MESEDDDVTKQIQDYYKKYSQDRKLPKYFSGTSVEYMPEIVSSEEIGVKSDSKSEKADKKAQTDYEEYCLENKPISPSSSVTSNRKLEWDNGADIGYSNYSKNKLHKSNSLPALLSDNPGVSTRDTGSDPPQILTVIDLSSSSSEVVSNNKDIQSSTSSCPVMTGPSVPSSTTEVETEKPAASSSSSSNFSSTLAYLKSRIGMPDAESTPLLRIPDVYVETPKPIKPPRKLSKRKVQLCITKAITVECIDVATKSAASKITQTSIERKCTKSVQTTSEHLEEADRVLEASSSAVTNQSVVLVNYDASESDRKSSTTQTGDASEALASQCDSFEYLYGSRIEEEVKSYGNLKRSEAQRDLVTSNSSSSKSPLASSELSSLNVTNKDMEKNIGILKRLLKSKKYDAATKKRYVKKIVKRIVEKDTSTSSSELFVPKQPESNGSELSNGVKIQQKLQQNVPWYPVHVSRNFTAKTFSDEFLPGPSYAASPSRSLEKTTKSKSIFTMTQQSKIAAGSSTSESHTSLEKQQDSSSQGYRNWKEEKTASERVLEERKGRGDQLVHFAQKERQHQIEWINDEISHLSKLKGLLEKNYDGVGGGVTRTTTVYVVSSSQRNSPNSGSQRPCCSSGSEDSAERFASDCPNNRNEAAYVIQTSIEGGISQPDAMMFNLQNGRDGMEYKVSENGAESARTRYMGDVQFSSDEKTRTTNITVRARKIPQSVGSKVKSSFDRFNLPATYPPSASSRLHSLPCGCSRPTTELDADKLSEIKRRWLNATPSANRPDPLPSDYSKHSKPDSKSHLKSPKSTRHGGLLQTIDSDEICQPCGMRKPPPFGHKCLPCGMPKYHQKEVPQPPPFYLDDVCNPCGLSRQIDDFSARLREVCDPHGMPRTREGFSTRRPDFDNDACIPCGMPKRTEILSKKRNDVCLPCGAPKYTEDFTQDDQVCQPCGMPLYKESSTQDERIQVCRPCGMPLYKETFAQDERSKICQPCGMSKNKQTSTQEDTEKTCQPCGMAKQLDRWKEVFSKIKDTMEKYDKRSLKYQTDSVENGASDLATFKSEQQSEMNKTRTVGCVCKVKRKPKTCICAGTQWSPEQFESNEEVKGDVYFETKGNLPGVSGIGSAETEVISETYSDGKSSSYWNGKHGKPKLTDLSSTKAQTDSPKLTTRLSQTDQLPSVSQGVQSGPQNVSISKSDTAQTDNPDLASHVIQTDVPRMASNLIQTDEVMPSSKSTTAQIPPVLSKGMQSTNSESRGSRARNYESLGELGGRPFVAKKSDRTPIRPPLIPENSDSGSMSQPIIPENSDRTPISPPLISENSDTASGQSPVLENSKFQNPKYAGRVKSASFSGPSSRYHTDGLNLQNQNLGGGTQQGTQLLPNWRQKNRNGRAPEDINSQRLYPDDRFQTIPAGVPQSELPLYGQPYGAPHLPHRYYDDAVNTEVQTVLQRQGYPCSCCCTVVPNMYGRQCVQTEFNQTRNQGVGASTVFVRDGVQTDYAQLVDGRIQTDDNAYRNQSSAAQTQREQNMAFVQTDHPPSRGVATGEGTVNVASGGVNRNMLSSPPKKGKGLQEQNMTDPQMDYPPSGGMAVDRENFSSAVIDRGTARHGKRIQESNAAYHRDDLQGTSRPQGDQTVPYQTSGISQTHKSYSKNVGAQGDLSKDNKLQTDNPNVSNTVIQTENVPSVSKRSGIGSYTNNIGTESVGAQSDLSKDNKIQTDKPIVSNNVIQTENVPSVNKRSGTGSYLNNGMENAGAQSNLSRDNKIQTDNSGVSNNVIQTENVSSKSKRSGTESYPSDLSKDNKVQTDNPNVSDTVIQTENASSMTKRSGTGSYLNNVGTDSHLQEEPTSYDSPVSSTKHEKSVTSDKQPQNQELVSYDSRTTESDSESSSSSSESTTSSLSTCICCKRKDSGTFYTLRKKLSQHSYPLCKPCFAQNGNWSPEQFINTTHVCQCYTVVETRTLDEIKKTMNDIDDLDNRKCTCSEGRRKSCKHCSCKLRKTRHGKNGIAYMLTFEPESRKDQKRKKKHRHKKRSLEEIKIKIPMYKKHKDKENKKKRERHDEKRHSLQEYLKQNRPDFVEEAEFRRRIVLETKEQREMDMESKKLSLLKQLEQENNSSEYQESERAPTRNPTRRILTPKEILEINRRNYKKLPEVQQRLVDNRQKKLRMADKLIADHFNRKLRDNVLRGKLNLALDACVV